MRLLVVTLTTLAMALGGPVAEAVAPFTPAMDVQAQAATAMGMAEGPAAAPAVAPDAMECERCLADRHHHCDAPVHDAVRGTPKHKEPHAPGRGHPHDPVPRSSLTGAFLPTGADLSAPNLHLLQRLRV